MHIFDTEINDGLEQLLSATASIAYASVAEPSISNYIKNSQNIKALAGIEDKDLYYTQSILVTTSWNKNDDIFDKAEVWTAKNTPIHKPTNLEHDEATIVGHITSNWPITEDGTIIDPSTELDKLPDIFHILTGSVIYVGYTDEDLKYRTSRLISEIENGTKYVSMECFFKGFDYGLINKETGKYSILSRNNETAFLTKHLRSYGGIGEYQNHKIGRVLRDITFSGKGFVNKPANPNSVIFAQDKLFFGKSKTEKLAAQEKINDFSEEGVISNQANLKETDMNLETEITELKTKLEEAVQAKDAMTQEYLNKLGVSEEDKKKMKAEFDASLEQEVASKAQLEAEMKTKCDELQTALDQANEVIAAYKTKEAEMMKKEKKMKRMAALVETGVDAELASSTVEKFENLDDEAFDSMAQIFAAMTVKKKMTQDEEAMVMKKKASEATTVTSEILETAETTEDSIDLSVGSEDSNSEVENTRAALVDFVYNRLGKKLNKGE